MTYPKTESREPLTFGDGSDTPERVQWPFGHGLSYTKFAYADAELSSGVVTRIGGVGDCVKAAVMVKNVGEMAGAEVVQLYITAKGEPVRLRGFARVALKPGETKRVEFSVPLELFARWRGDNNGAWSVEPAEYEIRLGRDAWDKSRVLAVRLEGAPLRFPRRTLFFSAAK
jgi:beta-glucosidase